MKTDAPEVLERVAKMDIADMGGRELAVFARLCRREVLANTRMAMFDPDKDADRALKIGLYTSLAEACERLSNELLKHELGVGVPVPTDRPFWRSAPGTPHPLHQIGTTEWWFPHSNSTPIIINGGNVT